MTDCDTVQSLNKSDTARVGLAYLWERLCANPDPMTVATIVHQLDYLPQDEQRRWLRGKRGRIYGALADCESRSGAYELMAAGALGVVLKELDLVDDNTGSWRDCATGRRVTTKLREVARLKWDWDAEENKAWLEANWPNIAQAPITNVKAWVRENNADARSAPRNDP